MPRFIISLCLSVVLLSACGGEKQQAAEEKTEEPKVEETAKAEAITAEMLAEKHNLEEGKTIYEANCKACHMMGVGGAPKQGDKAAWEGRVSQGMETLVKKSIEGYTGESGMMPAKGGNAELTDEQVGNAVAFMVSEVL